MHKSVWDRIQKSYKSARLLNLNPHSRTSHFKPNTMVWMVLREWMFWFTTGSYKSAPDESVLHYSILTHRQLEHPKTTKINKIMLLPPPHWFPTKSSQYENWKTNKYFILTLIGLVLEVLESSTRITKFKSPLLLSIILQYVVSCTIR